MSQVVKPLIRLKKLVKKFESKGGEFTALKGIDLEIYKGEYVGIVGKSGSGKTTLLNMLTGIDRPTSGEIHVDSQAVHALKESRMAAWRGRNVGVVFQFFQLLPTLTILDNVMLPMDFCQKLPLNERKERAMMLLRKVGIEDQAHKLPSALSGGQQQRAAIARALANDPPILAADEPTGNLDSKTADMVFDIFDGLVKEGKTVIFITHDKEVAKRVSRCITITDGSIVEDSSWKSADGRMELGV